MREIRLYGSEGGGAGRSPYPYQLAVTLTTSVTDEERSGFPLLRE
jgi:hypothetical protein